MICEKCSEEFLSFGVSVICRPCINQIIVDKPNPSDNFTLTDNGKKRKYYGHPNFYRLLQQMADLHSRKNHDYAGSTDPFKNFRECNDMGISSFTGVMIRLTDKWSRLKAFMRQGSLKVKSESIEDTLLDNAVYSLIAIILHREEKTSTTKTATETVPNILKEEKVE